MLTDRTRGRRIARRIAMTGACAIAATALAASAALADGNPHVSFSQHADGSADVEASTGYVGTAKLDITRNGVLIATDTKTDYYIDIPVATLLSGDVATLYRDGVLAGTATYDGLPTINGDACAGRSTFTGTHAAADYFRAGGYDPSNYRLDNPATVIDGNPFTVTLARPLAAGYIVYAYSHRDVGAINVGESREVLIGACPAPPVPPVTPVTPVVAPPTDQQVLTALETAVDKSGIALSKLDPADLASGKSSTLPFVFPEPGTVVFQLTAPAAKAKPASASAKKKPVIVARGTKTVAASGSAKVKLKVTKAGKKLLRHAKQVRLTLKATFTPKRAAKPQTSTTAVTLKHKAKKKHNH